MILVVTFVFPAVFRGLFYPEPGTRIKCWRLMFLPNTDTFKYVQFVTDFTAGTSQYQIFTTTLWLKQVSLKTNHDLFQIGTLFFYALTKPEHWHSVVMIKNVSTCLWFCRNVHLFCRSGWRTMSNETNLYWSPVGEIQSDTAAKSVQTTQYNKQQVEFTMTKVKENKITYTNKWRKGERGAPPLPLFTVAQSTTAH